MVVEGLHGARGVLCGAWLLACLVLLTGPLHDGTGHNVRLHCLLIYMCCSYIPPCRRRWAEVRKLMPRVGWCVTW